MVRSLLEIVLGALVQMLRRDALRRWRLVSLDEDLPVFQLPLQVGDVGHKLSKADVVVDGVVGIVLVVVVGAWVLIGLVLEVLERICVWSNLEAPLPHALILRCVSEVFF